MTVLRMNTDDHSFSRRRGGYSVFLSRQDRSFPAARRDVIAEKKAPLPAFSTEGVRWDVLVITLSLVLLVFIGILAADLNALYTGGTRIGRLSSGIASIEESNDLLRAEISRASLKSFRFQRTESTEPERIVILSPSPAEE